MEPNGHLLMESRRGWKKRIIKSQAQLNLDEFSVNLLRCMPLRVCQVASRCASQSSDNRVRGGKVDVERMVPSL